jgi:hypothetical protein
MNFPAEHRSGSSGRRKLSLAMLLVIMLSAAVPIADASPVAPVSATFCGSSATAANIADALIGSDSLQNVREISRVTVVLERKGELVELRRSDGKATLTALSVTPTARVCLAYPPDTVLLESTTAVSGSTLAALSAVLRYRQNYTWPSAYPANPHAPGTTVYITARGPYEVVHFVDDPHLTHQGETCAGEEFYRVNLVLLSVYPFNGCLVGGSWLPLPHLNELPD